MSQDTVAFERCELAAWGDFLRSAPDAVCHNLGIRVADINGAVLGSVAAVDILAFNRVLGMGVERPATPDMIDDAIGVFRSSGVCRFFIQVSPVAQPADLPTLLEERGFTHYNNWVRLSRDVKDIPDIACDLDIHEIGTDLAAEFGRIVGHSFDWPADVQRLIGGVVSRPGWHHYMAYDGNTPVATGAFFHKDDIAWFDFAATLPAHRGRGAQKALVARRLRDAGSRCCRHAIVETAEQKPGKDSPSYRNMLKMGFEEMYLRPNYIWERKA